MVTSGKEIGDFENIHATKRNIVIPAARIKMDTGDRLVFPLNKYTINPDASIAAKAMLKRLPV